MIAYGIDSTGLSKALKNVNKKYKNNVVFNREPEAYGKGFRFTLRCKDSKKPGHRLSTHGEREYTDKDKIVDRLSGNKVKEKARRFPSACWHVHGDYFDEVFKISPDARIVSKGKNITSSYGNWEDNNIGSMMNPCYHSEACECE